MRGLRPLVLVLIFAALAGAAAYFGWAFHAASKINRGWTGLDAALPFLLAGVVAVEALIGGFVWLAVYSEKHGYDDRAGTEGPD